MKILLLIIPIIIFLGLVASGIVLISMGISSRDLWEFRNELEKENKELLRGEDKQQDQN